ncbi:MAG: hypothetical protein AB3N15_09235 [Paracoccaceae bacterium]
MSRLIGAAVALIALAAVYYFAFYQEPTPTEQLDTAAQDAGDAVQDAASGLGEAVSDAAQSVTETINDSAAALADGAGSLQEQGQALIQQLQDEGLLTQAEFDYDAIVTKVEASPLVQVVKDQVIAILGEIREAPEQFDAGMDKLKALFQG